ncbi:hypothetical protein FKM82_020273 [Ascaphus truei]
MTLSLVVNTIYWSSENLVVQHGCKLHTKAASGPGPIEGRVLFLACAPSWHWGPSLSYPFQLFVCGWLRYRSGCPRWAGFASMYCRAIVLPRHLMTSHTCVNCFWI